MNIVLEKAQTSQQALKSINSKNLDFITPILFGGSAFQYLNAGCELGLFELLFEKKYLSKLEIGGKLCLKQRALDILLFGLTSLKLIIQENGFYKNHDAINALFLDNSWKIFKDVVAFEQYIVYGPQIDFVESLRENTNIGIRNVSGKGRDLYHRLSENKKLEEVFYEYMDSWTRMINQALIQGVNLEKCKKMIDVGGGTGINSIAFAQKYPHLQIEILEIPGSAEIAQQYIDNANLSNQISVKAGDMFRDQFTQGVDCVLFSHQLVIWTDEEIKMLLQKAYDSLRDNGSVIIFSSMANDDFNGPLMAALDSVYFAALPAEGGMIYSYGQYEDWLNGVGFKSIQRQKLNTWSPHGIIVATK